MTLAAITRRFLTDEKAARESIAAPVLVMEEAPLDEDDSLLFGTSVGVAPAKAEGGEEGRLFVIEKRVVNAFPMGITLGRTPNNDIVIDDNSVSRFHAIFQQDPRTKVWLLRDAESSGGTWVNDARLTGVEPKEMPDMARVRFGAVETFYFEPDRFFDYLQGTVRP